MKLALPAASVVSVANQAYAGGLSALLSFWTSTTLPLSGTSPCVSVACTNACSPGTTDTPAGTSASAGKPRSRPASASLMGTFARRCSVKSFTSPAP